MNQTLVVIFILGSLKYCRYSVSTKRTDSGSEQGQNRIVKTVKDHINGRVHNFKNTASWIKINESNMFSI